MQPQSIEKHSLYYNIKDACESKYCPICFLLDKKERQYIESIFYEYVNDPLLRKKLRDAQGLCQGHVKLFLKYGDAFALAIFANDLVHNFIEDWNEHIKLSECSLCKSFMQNEKRLVDAFVEYLALEKFWQALENSTGLCLQHFYMTYQQCPDKKMKIRLLNWQKQMFSRHKELLGSFIDKNNASCPHDDINVDEGQSYQVVWHLLKK